MGGLKSNRWILSLIFIVVLLPRILPSFYQIPSLEGAVYLNIAKNILEGRNAISLAIYQQFKEGFPFFLYGGVLFSLFITFLAKIFFNIQFLILCLSLLSVISAFLTYFLFTRIFKDGFVSLISVILIFISWPFYHSTLFVWPSQLWLLIIIVSLLFFSKFLERKSLSQLFLSGLFLSLAFFVDFTSLFLGIFLTLFLLMGSDDFKSRLKSCMVLAVSFLIPIFIYELFCLLRYGILYPQQILFKINYTKALLKGGSYYRFPPYLAAKDRSFSSYFFIWLKAGGFGFKEFLKSLLFQFNFLSFFLILGGYFSFKKKRKELFFIAIGLFYAFCFSFFVFPYSYYEKYIIPELSIFPFFCFVPVGVIYFLKVLNITMDIFSLPRLFFWSAIFMLIGVLSYFTLIQNANFDYYYERSKKLQYLTQAVDWIRNNSLEKENVATSEYSEFLNLDNYIVSLPKAGLLNERSFHEFVKAFSIQLILMYKRRFWLKEEWLHKEGFFLAGEEEPFSNYYLVFKRRN